MATYSLKGYARCSSDLDADLPEELLESEMPKFQHIDRTTGHMWCRNDEDVWEDCGPFMPHIPPDYFDCLTNFGGGLAWDYGTNLTDEYSVFGAYTSSGYYGLGIHTDNIGTTAGHVNYSSGFEGSECGGSGTIANGADTAIVIEAWVSSPPAGAVSVRLNAALQYITTPEYPEGKSMGLGIALGSAPERISDCMIVDSFVLPVGLATWDNFTATFDIPLSLLPLDGTHFWLVVFPIDHADRGAHRCTISTWPYQDGWGNTWRVGSRKYGTALTYYWSTDYYGYDEACYKSGLRFEDLLISIGDGVTTIFQGLPTVDGSATWTLNGIHTEPKAYDDVTGVAEFSIPPGYQGKVRQSGFTR